MTHYAYYDREGRLQIIEVPKGTPNPFRISKPADAFSVIGFVTKARLSKLPDYNPEFDMSAEMDINGYARC